MRPEIIAWADRLLTRDLRYHVRVIEVGSHDVNGSLRSLFRPRRYVGVDLRPGPGVDVVAPAAALPFRDEEFDLVVCTEMLEHDPAFWLSLRSMWRVLRPGGHLVLTTCGFGFGVHEYPSDYYRFTVDGLRAALEHSAPWEVLLADEDLTGPTVRALARRPKARTDALTSLAC